MFIFICGGQGQNMPFMILFHFQFIFRHVEHWWSSLLSLVWSLYLYPPWGWSALTLETEAISPKANLRLVVAFFLSLQVSTIFTLLLLCTFVHSHQPPNNDTCTIIKYIGYWYYYMNYYINISSTGLCIIVATSWYASRVIADFNDPFFGGIRW